MATRFQFSIRSVLTGTALVGAVAGALCAKADFPALIALAALSVALPAVSVLGAIEATQNLRAFWVGAAFCLWLGTIYTTLTIMRIVNHVDVFGELGRDFIAIEAANMQPAMLLFWCFAPINGLACVAAKCLLWPRREPRA